MDEEIRKKILTLLEQHRIMTIATLRPDGWPKATTVGYVNEGIHALLPLRPGQPESRIRRKMIGITDHRPRHTDTPQVMEITGLSMAAHAKLVLDREEAQGLADACVEISLAGQPAGADANAGRCQDIQVTPTVISMLDYSKGFGHTDLVTC